MSDFRFEWQDPQDGNRRAAAEDLARSKTPSSGAIWAAAVDQESLTKQVLTMNNGDDQYDPGFRYDPKYVEDQMRTRGIPMDYARVLEDAGSQRQVDQMLTKMQHELEAQSVLANAGWKGAAAQLLIGMVDPVTLAASITPGGVAAWATKGGALKAVVKSGLVAGASNAAVEAALSAGQYTRDPWDTVFASVVGFGLGGAIGGTAGLLTKNAQNLFFNTALRKVERDFVEPGMVPHVDSPANLSPSKADDPLTVKPTQRVTETDDFKAWFGGSTILDEAGQPKRLFHGTPAVFDNFKESSGGAYGEGVYMTPHADHAAAYAKQPFPNGPDGKPVAVEAPNTRPVYASLKNPYNTKDPLPAKAYEITREHLEPLGYDGIVAGDEVIAFRASAVRSAVSHELRPGDLIEWDTPHGKVEKGHVMHDDGKGHTVVMDDTGNIREFRAGDHDPELEGAKYLGGSIGSGQIGQIETPKTAMSHLNLFGFKVPIRFDSFAYFDRQASDGVRKLGSLLLDDVVGKKATKVVDKDGVAVIDPTTGKQKRIHVANPLSAHEFATMELKRYGAETTAAFEDNFKALAKRMEVGIADRSRAARDFDALISKVTRDRTGALAHEHPEAAKAAREMAASRNRMLKNMQEWGVEGADEVADDANYLNRRWKWDRIAQMGADPELKPHMERLFAEAIVKMRPEMDLVKAKSIGKTIVKRMRHLQTDPKQLGFLSDTGFERLAAGLRQSGLDDDVIDDVLGFVFNQKEVKKGDAAAHPRLKKRILMDENHSVEWVDAAGEKRKLALHDLMENSVRELNDVYFKQTSGLTALARKGIRSKADYQALREVAREEMVEAGSKPEKINSVLEDLDRVVRHITGQPMYEGPSATWAKGLRILRNFNVANNLAQVGFAQIAETGQLMGLKSIMALRTNMSAYDDVLHTLQKGGADANLMRDLRAMGSVAEESKINRPHLKDYDPGEAALGRADDVAKLGAHYTLKASGMHAITEFQRGKIASMYSQRLLNIAVGAEKLDDALKARLATNGLGADELDDVLAAYKKHVRVADDGTVVGVDYDTWEHADHQTFDSFRLAVFRESHRSVQEISLGGAPLSMHSETARILLQFRSFVITAWAKQTLHGVAHADFQTFLNWSFSMVFGTLAYAAQTSLNFANNQKELDRRLDPWELAKAGVQRAGFSSLVPMAIDTALDFAIGDPMFKYGRSSNLATGFFLGNPSLTTAAKITGTLSAGSQNILTDDYMMTQKDFGYAAGLFPKFYGVGTLMDTMKQEYPRRNFLRGNEQ